MRVFSAASQYPWTIAMGSKEQNLQELASKPKPDEPVAAKIWVCMQPKVSSPGLVQEVHTALDLLLDCPWCTMTTEQQHASGSLVA
eukprot:11380740-Karenia_brevis.AAC.1